MLRYDVVKVAASAVTTRVTVRQKGVAIGTPATREDDPQVDLLARQATGHQATRSATKVALDVAGRQWEAILYEDRWTDEQVPYVRRTWVSDVVPFHGTIQMELSGGDQLEAKLTLVAWGQGEKK